MHLGDSVSLGGLLPGAPVPGMSDGGSARRVRLFVRMPEVCMPAHAWAAQMDLDWMEASNRLISTHLPC